jgi:hypothetical protein
LSPKQGGGAERARVARASATQRYPACVPW